MGVEQNFEWLMITRESKMLSTNGLLPKGERLLIWDNTLTGIEYLHWAWHIGSGLNGLAIFCPFR